MHQSLRLGLYCQVCDGAIQGLWKLGANFTAPHAEAVVACRGTSNAAVVVVVVVVVGSR